MGDLKGIGGQRWKCSEETKVITLEVEFESDLSRVVEEIADCRNVDLPAIIQEPLAMRPEKCTEGDLPA